MKYPRANELARRTITQDVWQGYSHNARISDGQMYDQKNMTSDEYPLLAPRKKRAVKWSTGKATGLIAKDALCWTAGSKFYMNGYEYDIGLSTGQKQLVSMGAYVIVFPDKKYINTKDTSDWGAIEAEWTAAASASVSMIMCQSDGNALSNVVIQQTAPENPTNGQWWLDIGSEPNTLRQWSESQGTWGAVPASYTKIMSTGIGSLFSDGDGVELSGVTATESAAAAELMGSTVIECRGNDYIVVSGLMERTASFTGHLKVSRKIPQMDFVIECHNRLWGCRYGLANNGSVVNEIYCSKLGDFKNWNVFQGISTDSWVGQCGSDGAWTGAVSFLGYPTFFKADHIHKVYGSLPSSFAIQDTVADGIEPGSAGSAAQVDSVLMYKARNGVKVYDGSMPRDVSEAFGGVDYFNAVAGAHGKKYYISMEDADENRSLFVYDRNRGFWNREDDIQVKAWCSARNHMYCIDGTGRILSVTGDGTEETAAVEWECETGELGIRWKNGSYNTPVPTEKWLQKLMMRVRMEKGSTMRIYAEFDGEPKWYKIATVKCNNKMRSFTMPLKMRRCDWMRLKISGTGDVKIYSISRIEETASDVNSGDGMAMEG